jgi:Ni,Fe-hydrogenase III small subunit
MMSKSPRRTAVWILPLDSGGCGACTQQIYALLAPRYAGELRKHGVSFARSPRHADVVLVTGALSTAAREPVHRLLSGVPQPRVLIAVGDCAISGCLFRDSSQVVSNAAEVLDVNVEIGGCPPTPHAILEAIAEATQLLAADANASPADDELAEEPSEERSDDASAEGSIDEPDFDEANGTDEPGGRA